MQQAVASSQFSLLPPSVSVAMSSLNRQLVWQRIKSALQSLNETLQELSLSDATMETTKTSRPRSTEDEVARALRDVLARLADGAVLDTLLAPLAAQPTFYENRYGFTESELLGAEFSNPVPRRLLARSKRLNDPFIARGLQYQQVRGFKTKRNQEADRATDSFFADLLKRRTDKFEPKASPMKVIDSLLSSSSASNASSKRLGSIFQQKSDGAKITSSNTELDNKIKIAFAEGLLYAKQEEKKNNPLGLLRFIMFVVVLVLLFSSISISTGSTTGNGKNGGGGGINIRALTGAINYEVNPETVSVKFDDVKGLPEAKKELTDIVDFLKDPEKYTKLGARLPKGVMLVGPPGCGKTLLAKSIAGEAGVPFFQASGSDFDEMFVGTGSKRVRQLFSSARAKAPCVIFIDEIDSVGSTRTNSMIHPHANQTINQLLAEMDGFQKNEGVIVLGATNRRDTLDSALMRPGRFDLEVRIDKPDLNARIEILEYYLDKVAKDDNVDVRYLARQLTGLGGSAIENVVNQAALRAVVTGHDSVKMEHLEWALDRALMGYGKSRLMDEECNKNTAYHEAGHVLVAYYTKDSDPLHKVTILPRSQSLGHTAFVPDNEGYSKTKSQLLAQMDVAMGGRVAEELAFGSDKVTTGASNDFRQATQIAMQMVKVLGMNDKIGIRVFEGSKNGDDLSPQTQELLDQEVKRQLQDSYERARAILKTHSTELKLVADALLVHETLDVDQIKKLIETHKL